MVRIETSTLTVQIRAEMSKRKITGDEYNSSLCATEIKKSSNDAAATRMSINSRYYENNFRKTLSHSYRNRQSFVDDITGATLYNQPFQCCCLPNFLSDTKAVHSLRNQLRKVKFFKKSNDLYSLNQSADLKGSPLPAIQSFRELLLDDVLPWLRDLTEIPLDDTLDITCSKYEYGDVLLCHDDELERRRIAFIYYLVPEWSSEDGGTLDLFSIDDNGDPDTVVKSLVPQWNNFVFFEVNTISFHQVSEVISKSKKRLSINGWFHGPNIDRPKLHKIPIPLISETETLTSLSDWINPVYLNIETQLQIRKQFEENSEIQLIDFLLNDKFNAVCFELRNHANSAWSRIGPANKCSTDISKISSLPVSARDCFDLFNSIKFYTFIATLTGLNIGGCKPLFSTETDESDSDTLQTDTSSNYSEDPDVLNNYNVEIDKGSGQLMFQEAPCTSNDLLSLPLDCKQMADTIDPDNSDSIHTRQCCCGNFRRWKHKYYTLIRDSDPEMTEFGLDTVIFFCSASWKPECGGSTAYIAKGEDDELLTIQPTDNTLSIVYRDTETIKFVKYINHRLLALNPDSKCPHFYDLAMTYYE
ncbi:Prolyl 3-hydroxylase OGFOD1 [Trichoplax sp. H2]|nr:Prolyl 3-hydroxylase OGFOD1 [Trichoplax sp. H2]|eukprot:RDD46140.1 Prolyl 3-hydroxylase OGFOD1 [Trichoplax sp. H2]